MEPESPVHLVAKRASLELISVFEQFAQNPATRIKIKLLKHLIECREGQDGSADGFKELLEALSACEVNLTSTFIEFCTFSESNS